MDIFNNDTFNIIIRCVVAMTTLFFMTKLLGKKQVSELSLFDYVVGISIGNFASEMAINLEAEFFNALLAIVVFGLLAYIISILTLKSLKLRKFFVGAPTILIENGKIETTLDKAKVLRGVVEPLITLAKIGDVPARRLALKKLPHAESVRKLFHEIAPVFKDRNGGYTRVLKTGRRQGDNAEMAIIEFVEEIKK